MRYTFKIKGVRKSGTVDYGTVSGAVKIPKAKISEKKAIANAVQDAVTRYGITKSTVQKRELDFENYRGTKVFEVEFKARKNGRLYTYEYLISRSTGKVLSREQD